MKIKSPTLVLYWLSSICFVAFFMLGWDYPALIAKSCVVPSIGMYYLNSRNGKLSFLPISIFLFCYIGDVAVLIDQQDFFIYSAYAFLVVYSLMLIYAVKDLKYVIFKKRDMPVILVVTGSLIYVVVTVLEMQFSNPKGQNFLYLIYAFVLTVLSILVFAGYTAKGSLQYLSFGLAITCFILSDIFYSIKSFYVYSDLIQFLTIAMQMLSYFFLAKYFIMREAEEAQQLQKKLSVD